MCFADFVKTDTLVQRFFFDFFLGLSAKAPTFESFFGRLLARTALRSRCFRWEVHDKVKKTSSDSSSGLGRLLRSSYRILDPVSWIRDPRSWIQDP